MHIGTFEAAYDAVQVALTASDILMEDDNTHVLALCRPPGHHAEADLCGGYCFFNNAAIAAKYLIDDLNVGKVAILDIDYHHGNGTQNMFYNVSNPFYCSIHGDPDYPYYWGSADEDGEGEGKGFTKNIPLPKGTGDEVYLKNLAEALHIIKNYNPKVVVVSVGLDTFELDPIGCFKLTSNCYREIGDLIKKFFFGEVKLLFVLEGGYAIDQIGLNLMNIFESF
ncbi:hypothetical protein HK099_008451 [Clydaea vesicula]|uniref:Histone deacetylase domain-containing protein n=1 Tax=Clydaea vesicula TaxID=447962 RepID=A0AAD5U4W0_9FUNG|nr:hypothetical protein HK099_008451 [Clydaea vesicula]